MKENQVQPISPIWSKLNERAQRQTFFFFFVHVQRRPFSLSSEPTPIFFLFFFSRHLESVSPASRAHSNWISKARGDVKTERKILPPWDVGRMHVTNRIYLVSRESQSFLILPEIKEFHRNAYIFCGRRNFAGSIEMRRDSPKIWNPCEFSTIIPKHEKDTKSTKPTAARTTRRRTKYTRCSENREAQRAASFFFFFFPL